MLADLLAPEQVHDRIVTLSGCFIRWTTAKVFVESKIFLISRDRVFSLLS